MPVQDRHGIHEAQPATPATTEIQPQEFQESEQQQNPRRTLTTSEEVRMGCFEGTNPINWLTTIFMV